MNDSALRPWFLWIARLEGISLLVLFFVAMPLKYGAGWEHATTPPGWAHGVLFVAYVAAAALLARAESWSLPFTGLAMLASFVPFGTFALERSLTRGEG